MTSEKGKELKWILDLIKQAAFEIPPPNIHTPHLVALVQEAERQETKLQQRIKELEIELELCFNPPEFTQLPNEY